MQRRSLVPGVLMAIGGLVLAGWVVAGRAFFGLAGELVPIYTFTLGLTIVVLHAFIGDGVARTALHGHRTRPATIGTWIASWGCGLLLGLMIPDVTPLGLQTILSGPEEPGLGIAIGVANPLGIIMLVTAIVSLALARGDAKGLAAKIAEDED